MALAMPAADPRVLTVYHAIVAISTLPTILVLPLAEMATILTTTSVILVQLVAKPVCQVPNAQPAMMSMGIPTIYLLMLVY